MIGTCAARSMDSLIDAFCHDPALPLGADRATPKGCLRTDKYKLTTRLPKPVPERSAC